MTRNTPSNRELAARAKLPKVNPWHHERRTYLTPEAIGAAIESGVQDEAKATVQQVVLEAFGNCEDASLCAHMAAHGSADHKWMTSATTVPRVTHWEHGATRFCGAIGGAMTADEADVTCRRCLHKIGIQDSV